MVKMDKTLVNYLLAMLITFTLLLMCIVLLLVEYQRLGICERGGSRAYFVQTWFDIRFSLPCEERAYEFPTNKNN